MNICKESSCCFTGHRKMSSGQHNCVVERIKSEIILMIENGVRYFCAGGALGFDTIAALTVLSLKNKYPHIRLILVLPCRDQTNGWREADIKTYNHIFENADTIVYTSEFNNVQSLYFLFQTVKFRRAEKFTESYIKSVTQHFNRYYFWIFTFTIQNIFQR